MACKVGYRPEHHNRCTRWMGKKGMTSQPTMGSPCKFCLNWVEPTQ